MRCLYHHYNKTSFSSGKNVQSPLMQVIGWWLMPPLHPTTPKKITSFCPCRSLKVDFFDITFSVNNLYSVHKGSRKQIMPSNGNIRIWLIAQNPTTDYIPHIELFHLTLHAAIYPNIFLTAQSKCYFSCCNSFIYIMPYPLCTKVVFIARFFKKTKNP